MSRGSKFPEALPLAKLAPAIIDAAGRMGLGADVVVRDETRVRRVWTNEVVSRLLGMSPDQALERAPEADVAVRLASDVLPRGAESPARDLLVVDGEMIRSDHCHVPVHLARIDVGEGESAATVRCVTPIGEQRETAQALELSERRFCELLDASPDWVVIAQEGAIVYVNRVVMALGGFESQGEVLGAPLSTVVHSEDVPALLQSLDEVVRTGRASAPAEYRLCSGDGSVVVAEVISMVSEWGERPAVLAIGRLTASRREAEAEFMQADRLSAIGTLAAGVAHEINNPLAYVLLNLHYLVRELPKLSREPHRVDALIERLQEAQHGAVRVRAIVRDLRDFSLPSSTEMGAVELRRVLAAAMKVSRAQVDERVRLVADYRATPPVVGDAARLEQVFLNLIVNAADAFDSSCSTDREVVLRLYPVGDERVAAEVSDNGVGIPSELVDRVFDPFFTTKPAGLGTGLGLPICHSIVTAHRGTITVESGVGKGTTFRVVLPVHHVPVPAASIAPPPLPVVEDRLSARVLVVDDEEAVAAMVGRLLADEFDVEIATSGGEALEALLRDPTFDLVLCDLLMPGMSGMELYRELEHRAPHYPERLVFMTGGAFTEEAAEFLEEVRQPRLEKPFDLEQVRKVVRRAVRKG